MYITVKLVFPILAKLLVMSPLVFGEFLYLLSHLVTKTAEEESVGK